MRSSSQARGRNTQSAASGVPVPNLKLRLRLGARSPTSPRGVGIPLTTRRTASSSTSVRSPHGVAQSATGVAAGACHSPRGEGKFPSPRGEGRSPARANPLINRGNSPKKARPSSARKVPPEQGNHEGQSAQSASTGPECLRLAKQRTLRRFSDCSTDCTQSSTLSLHSDGAFSFMRSNAQAPEPSPAATIGQASTLMTVSSSSNSSHCSSLTSLASMLDSSSVGFGRVSKADVASTEEGPDDFSLLSDVTFTETCATDATSEDRLDSMLRTTQGLIRAASAIMTPPVPTSGPPLSGSQSARVVRPASKKAFGSFSSPRQARRASAVSPRCAAEVEELRSRVNHLESELQKLRLGATRGVMAASDEDPTALRMLLVEWERQLTEARAHQEEASGDFRDIRNQLCSLMLHVASLSASCGHGASSGTAQTARMPVSYASAHAAAGTRPVQAPASHLLQARCTKSTPCMNGHVNLHAPMMAPHLRSNASMPSSLSAPGRGGVPGWSANQSLMQRFNSGTVQRFQSVPPQGARQRFSVSSSGSAS
eukprot:TRINITY_DN26473_c0_g1_i1.p1 TRINITY_DN26473_c0_g1~~TRINITY_DN26473_c0_g1_i1.p1  ORF type:complete len:541 (+),score=62.40 TRINITY_DN26473_c0_g1_i1:68-1690(+)